MSGKKPLTIFAFLFLLSASLLQTAAACEWYDLPCVFSEGSMDFSILGSTVLHVKDSCGSSVPYLFVYRNWEDGIVAYDSAMPKYSETGTYGQSIKSSITSYTFCREPRITYSDHIITRADPRGSDIIFWYDGACMVGDEYTSNCALSGGSQVTANGYPVNVNDYRDYVDESSCVTFSVSSLLSSTERDFILPGCVRVCDPGEVMCSGQEVLTCNQDGTGWNSDPCDAGYICQNGGCVLEYTPPPPPPPSTPLQLLLESFQGILEWIFSFLSW